MAGFSGTPQVGRAIKSPKWLQLFSMVARRLPFAGAEGHISCAFAPPVVEYFPAAFSLMSVSQKEVSIDRPKEPLGRVASLINSSLQDREHTFNFNLDGSPAKEFLGMTPFKEGTFPPVVKLPDGFPHRADSSIPEGVPERLQLAGLGSNIREACWTYFQLCAKPVVILCQNPSAIAVEIGDIAAATLFDWKPEQLCASAEVGVTPDAWYRRPIICMSPRSVQWRPWLAELTPSAVVVIGYSAWETPARWFWPKVPHSLFLNTRSDDVLRFRMWHDGQVLPQIDSELANLAGIPGLPAKIFAEPSSLSVDPADFDWEDYGADFD